MDKFADIVVDNKAQSTDSFYTYKVPENVGVGAKVTVMFGVRKKPIDGYVVRLNPSPKFDTSKIRLIDSYDESRALSSEMIETAMWMRQRYGIKYIDAIKMFVVSGKKESMSKNESVKEGKEPSYEISHDQLSAAKKVCDSLDQGKGDRFLINGVTGSGKTEVYMLATKKCLELGKTAIILLPEIALSSQVKKRFEERFGEENIAVMHSKLSTSKRLGEWLKIRRGEARIIIGARTAIFAPVENLGLVVIDEEHEATYKSDHNPKYETVDIAYKRSEAHKATMVLGSATPSVVSYNRAENGIYKLIEMPNRIGDSPLPTLEIADMRKEKRRGNLGEISLPLAREINKALSKKEQIILFLNRRGFSTQIMCPSCGYKMECPDCGITLTYHKNINAAVCHYCGRKYPLPDKCTECGHKVISYVGAGTEKIEELAQSMWPSAIVERFDLDTASKPGDVERVIKNFDKGKTNILVGTQILAKGLDFKNVGLVGIINADMSLNIPDYRSSERTYQLITQVAGRAGRDGEDSKVIIQTYEPDSEVINYASKSDYLSFYKSELLHRNIMNYPPYSDIISVTLSDIKKDTNFAMEYATKVRDIFAKIKDAPEDAVILSPRESYRKSDGNYRVSFMIKAPLGSRAGYMKAYMWLREEFIKANAPCYIEIDVNPYGMI